MCRKSINAPLNPTYALHIVDNWDGEGDRYWIFAFLDDGVFYCHENSEEVLSHVGDEILKRVEL